MKKNFLENFFYQSLYQITLIILPIITIPIISHALGVDGIGTYNYIMSIVSYFILFAGLGLANYGIREIASVRDSQEERSRKFWNLELFNLIVVFVIISVYLLFLISISNKSYFLIAGISVIATLFDISWFYYGIQDFKYITVTNTIIKIISFICIIIFIKDTSDLLLYFFIQSISILVSNVSLWFFLKGKIIWVRPNIKSSMLHLKPAANYFIGKISITLYTTLNKTLLGLFVTATAVGLYSNSLQLITMCVMIIGVLDTVLMPHMTSLFVNNKEKNMILVMEKTVDLQLFFSIPIMFGIILTNSKMVPWFYGDEFLYLNKTVPILAILIVIMPLGISIVKQFLIPKNNIREFNLSVGYAAIVSIVTNILLLPSAGLWGAIIATILSEFIVTLVRIIKLVRTSSFRFNLKNILVYILSGLMMLIITQKLTLDMDASIKTTIIQILIGVLIYFGFVTLCGRNILLNYIRKK